MEKIRNDPILGVISSLACAASKKLIHGVVSKPACAWSTTLHMKILGKMGRCLNQTTCAGQSLAIPSSHPAHSSDLPPSLPLPPRKGLEAQKLPFSATGCLVVPWDERHLGVETWKVGDQQEPPLPLQEHQVLRLLQAVGTRSHHCPASGQPLISAQPPVSHVCPLCGSELLSSSSSFPDLCKASSCKHPKTSNALWYPDIRIPRVFYISLLEIPRVTWVSLIPGSLIQDTLSYPALSSSWSWFLASEVSQYQLAPLCWNLRDGRNRSGSGNRVPCHWWCASQCQIISHQVCHIRDPQEGGPADQWGREFSPRWSQKLGPNFGPLPTLSPGCTVYSSPRN